MSATPLARELTLALAEYEDGDYRPPTLRQPLPAVQRTRPRPPRALQRRPPQEIDTKPPTAPPRNIKRLRTPLIADTRYPVLDPEKDSVAIRDILAVCPKIDTSHWRALRGTLPKNTQREIEPKPEPLNELEFIYFDGKRSNKRRAQDSEIDLVGNVQGSGSRARSEITRQDNGPVNPATAPAQPEQPSDLDGEDIIMTDAPSLELPTDSTQPAARAAPAAPSPLFAPVGFVRWKFAEMKNACYNAGVNALNSAKKACIDACSAANQACGDPISVLRRDIHHMLFAEQYQVAEIRSYVDGVQFANVRNKRIKLSVDDKPEKGLEWITPEHMLALQKTWEVTHEPLHATLHKVFLTDPKGDIRARIIRKLQPLAHLLNTDMQILHSCGATDLALAFCFHIERALNLLGGVYNFPTMLKMSEQSMILKETVNYGISPQELDVAKVTISLFSAPLFPAILGDVMKMVSKTQTIDTSAIDLIVMDLKAISHGLPAPSYVLEQRYRSKFYQAFPPAARTDFDTQFVGPGAFPVRDDEGQFVETSESEKPIEEEIVPAQLPTPAPPPPPRTASPPPVIVITEPAKSKKLRVKLWKRGLKKATSPQSYYARFGMKPGENDAAIKAQYITEYDPQPLISTKDRIKIGSILKYKYKHESHRSPKRLTQQREPKKVRFADDTLSPRPRSHIGLEIPRRFDKEDDEEGKAARDSSVRPSTPEQEEAEQESTFADNDSDIFAYSSSAAQSPIPVMRHHPRAIPHTPPPRRISDILRGETNAVATPHTATSQIATPHTATPQTPADQIRNIVLHDSPRALELSAETRLRITRQREEAEARAAEEARVAAEQQAKRELEEKLARTGGLRVPEQTFVGPISDYWAGRAQATRHAASTTILATTSEGVELNRHSFIKVVEPREWLNDEIVNGTLSWLDRAINQGAGIKNVRTQGPPKCLSLSSFFYKRLVDNGVAKTERALRRFGVEKSNFFKVDTILIPICERSHWTLLVIRPGKKTVAHMDSLNRRGSRACTNLAMAWVRAFLGDEFVEEDWRVVIHEAPEQINGHDCGVHAITNGMCVALGLNPIDSYTAEDMPLQRLRIASMLLNNGFSGDFDLTIY
ncbi:hypothetical protein S7711_05248 [Stachybotrys chartarum IBT 7711]|uniref:Ubiquitin-like protease family profile domain-containing protein n=1 Tax=Stachybotrys chartarum (strain CBS 109288 / IBT 7711) TaxID=1280523 RepID=A0A084AGK0_STACB|nr:hypothetical protein S7711_05248 [Stachybotrys chartarum IBT 7711]